MKNTPSTDTAHDFRRATRAAGVLSALMMLSVGCSHFPRPGTLLPRSGDEIMVCGKLYHTGTRVILWVDPHGYDAYRVEPRFSVPPAADASADADPPDATTAAAPAAAPTIAPSATSGAAPESPAAQSASTAPASSSTSTAPATSTSPATRPAARARPAPRPPEGARYGSWRRHVPSAVMEAVQKHGWSHEQLREHVDLFVLHYDVCGTSRQCFKVLHDIRGLSVQFMIDLDGTIYQTLDLKERAWHAGSANDRSVGVEIANIGAYPLRLDGSPANVRAELDRITTPVALTDLRWRNIELPRTLDEWYDSDALGRPFVVLPGWMKESGLRTPDFVARPARRSPIIGPMHGRLYAQYDFTDEQYHALARLTATLNRVLPRIELRFPRDDHGRVPPRELSADELAAFSGVLGHYHLTKSKQDPGPAFDWERLDREARAAQRRW